MANTATRGSMRDFIRQRTDMVSSLFVTDAELNGWIDASGSELHDLLVARFQDIYETSSSINIIAGTDTYTLPTDFYKETGVDYVLGGQAYSLRRFMRAERNKYRSAPYVLGFPSGMEWLEYRITGNSIKFIPVPMGAGVVTLWYIPQYTLLASDGTVVSVGWMTGWEEYVIADCCIKVAQKEQTDPSVYMAQKEAVKQRIITAASDRHAGEPPRMVDVDSEPVPWGTRWP